MKKIIFHYAGAFYDTLDTGEKVRPRMMYEAFKSSGYEVLEIVGTYQERKKIFEEIKNRINEFEFIYSENRTLPLRLSGKKHLPVFLGNCDFDLFRLGHKHNIPIGVFYRDIYWDYPTFSQEIGYLKHLLAKPFYREELKLYAKYADIVFTPSTRFIERIDHKQHTAYYPLPPGGSITDTNAELHHLQSVNIAYVGSINPPIYDVSVLLENIAEFRKDELNLTIFTRESDLLKTKNYYIFPQNSNVRHLSGEALKKQLSKFDISMIYFKPSDYRRLCMPLKLFESIGAGLPIISYGDSAVSDFVRENDIGWVVSEDDKENIFEYLINNRNEIAEKRKNVLAIRSEHTWEKRAKEVADQLLFRKVKA